MANGNLIIFLIISIPLLTDQDVIAQITPDEKLVWQLENSYYQYAKENNTAAYLSLFHEDVIGWPASNPEPKGKDQVSQWISLIHAVPSEEWNYELRLHRIKSFDNVVIVHYSLREFFISSESGNETKSSTYKISHTWLFDNEKWQIIGGMGGNLFSSSE